MGIIIDHASRNSLTEVLEKGGVIPQYCSSIPTVGPISQIWPKIFVAASHNTALRRVTGRLVGGGAGLSLSARTSTELPGRLRTSCDPSSLSLHLSKPFDDAPSSQFENQWLSITHSCSSNVTRHHPRQPHTCVCIRCEPCLTLNDKWLYLNFLL